LLRTSLWNVGSSFCEGLGFGVQYGKEFDYTEPIVVIVGMPIQRCFWHV